MHDFGLDSSEGLIAGDTTVRWCRGAVEYVDRVLHGVVPEAHGGVAGD